MLRRAGLPAAAAVAAAGAYIRQQWNDYQSVIEGSANAELHLPLSVDAQKTNVVHVKNFLSPAEIDSLHELHDELKPLLGTAGRTSGNQAAAYRAGSWETTYLSTDGHFARARPELRERFLRTARAVDSKHWRLLERATEPVVPRCVEYHTVEPGGSLPYPTHYDAGSLVTVDVMLSDTSEFEGGQFATLEADGSMKRYDFERGDALFFVSHKYHWYAHRSTAHARWSPLEANSWAARARLVNSSGHVCATKRSSLTERTHRISFSCSCLRRARSVSPVTAGRRNVLVVELWEGEERECAHRCERHRGECGHTARASFWRRALSDLASDL